MSLSKFLTFLFFLILGCVLKHYTWTKLPCYICKSKARILVYNSRGYEHVDCKPVSSLPFYCFHYAHFALKLTLTKLLLGLRFIPGWDYERLRKCRLLWISIFLVCVANTSVQVCLCTWLGVWDRRLHTLGNFIGRNTRGSSPKMLARRLEPPGGSIYMYYGVSYHMFAFL